MKRESRILVFDQGNTRVKMSLFERGRRTAEYARPADFQDELLGIAESLECGGGIYSGVGHLNTRFVESLRHIIGERFLLFTNRTPLPIADSYATPLTLGADRLAAAVGAWSLAPGKRLLIVDAGTAITADLLTPERGFEGGAISPGIRMRLRSLADMTARLPFVEPSPAPLVGDSTEYSLLSGALNGAALEIAGRARALGIADDCVFLTGGDAPMLQQTMRRLGLLGALRLEPELLGRGLYEIFIYNNPVL